MQKTLGFSWRYVSVCFSCHLHCLLLQSLLNLIRITLWVLIRQLMTTYSLRSITTWLWLSVYRSGPTVVHKHRLRRLNGGNVTSLGWDWLAKVTTLHSRHRERDNRWRGAVPEDGPKKGFTLWCRNKGASIWCGHGCIKAEYHKKEAGTTYRHIGGIGGSVSTSTRYVYVYIRLFLAFTNYTSSFFFFDFLFHDMVIPSSLATTTLIQPNKERIIPTILYSTVLYYQLAPLK